MSQRKHGYAMPVSISRGYAYATFHRTGTHEPKKSLCRHVSLDATTIVDEPPDGTLCRWCARIMSIDGEAVPDRWRRAH